MYNTVEAEPFTVVKTMMKLFNQVIYLNPRQYFAHMGTKAGIVKNAIKPETQTAVLGEY